MIERHQDIYPPVSWVRVKIRVRVRVRVRLGVPGGVHDRMYVTGGKYPRTDAS